MEMAPTAGWNKNSFDNNWSCGGRRIAIGLGGWIRSPGKADGINHDPGIEIPLIQEAVWSENFSPGDSGLDRHSGSKGTWR